MTPPSLLTRLREMRERVAKNLAHVQSFPIGIKSDFAATKIAEELATLDEAIFSLERFGGDEGKVRIPRNDVAGYIGVEYMMPSGMQPVWGPVHAAPKFSDTHVLVRADAVLIEDDQ